jgi:pSer/pThr/pTyr-binding forkhead associated (FHA) protein
VAEVVVELGGKEILRVPLKGPTMSIGRDPQCDLHLDNRALSRRHAQIEKRGAAIWVRDLQSQNGTFVNGSRINDPQALNGGDRIEVGRYEVRIDGVEEARQDTPVLTLTGPEGRHRFAMVGDEIILGRAPSCDIAIGHKSISRRHLRIAVEGDRFIAEDLGSQNGSRINNKRINGPTPFRIGDKVQMSEFTIEVGYLEAPETNAGNGGGGGGAANQKVHKTMMIDRSELAKAAYVGGDFEKMGNNAGNISMGAGGKDDEYQQLKEEDSEERDQTRGIPQESAEAPPPPAPPAPAPRPSSPTPQKPPPPTKKPPQPKGPVLTVTHPDTQEHNVVFDGEAIFLGEDGSVGDTTEGRTFANHGYVMLAKTGKNVVATVVGDRRLLTVNGKAMLYAALDEGDTLELGVLTIVFHLQG